jgi:hypothetical protein
MTEGTDESKNQFLNPKSKFYGNFSPENLAFDANLQEFANRVSIICALETGGKITPLDAYEQIKALWKQVKVSKKNLLDQPKPPEPDLPDA